jgi:hypothetical protein
VARRVSVLKEKMFYGMLKKLDAMHIMQRISHQINCEHPRFPKYIIHISKSIITLSKEDTYAVESAREVAGIGDLGSKQLKYDKTKYMRRVIENPKAIIGRILVCTKTQIALDRQAKLQFQESGQSCTDLTTAHPAYPLMTKKVLKCVVRQCTHVLNECVHDETQINVESGK